jgi:O-antigen ligase
MGAALGLIMATLHEAFAGKKVTPLLVYEYLCSPAARVIWLLVGIVVLGASTVFVSLTRWGMVSMLIAGAFTTLVLASGRSLRGRSWIMALMATGAFVCVLYIGFDAVYDRLATLPGLHQHQGHWQILKDLSISLSRFPVFGTGLGTHEVVYPMFDRSATPALATHAENEYAQAAEETGLVGLGLLVSLAIIVWSNYVRNVRTGCVPIRSATYGLGFGLLAVMIHSLGDSGQHVPANAFLSVVYCSLLLALVRAGQKDDMAAEAGRVRRGFRSLRIAALVCVSAVWAWALLGADSARVAEAHWKEALGGEHTISQDRW